MLGCHHLSWELTWEHSKLVVVVVVIIIKQNESLPLDCRNRDLLTMRESCTPYGESELTLERTWIPSLSGNERAMLRVRNQDERWGYTSWDG